MNNDIFINSCFYNSNTLSIIFDQKMNLQGNTSIICSDNYCIYTNTETIPLNRIVTSIYTYADNYISFIINSNYLFLINESVSLQCGYVEKKEIKYLTNSTGIVHNICITTPLKSYLTKLSFESAYAFSYMSNSIILENSNIISYNQIFIEDFYVIVNDKTYTPYRFEKINYNKIQFTFTEDIINTPTDLILLKTINNCSSTDILGNTIKSNDSINVDNNLPTKIHNVSYISYINNTLILGITFTSPVIRYDSSDFEVYINDIYYAALGHSSYTNKYMNLTINNLYNFNYKKDKLLLKTSDNSTFYTIDYRNLPVSDPNGVYGEVFLSQYGTLSYNNSNTAINYSSLNIYFNTLLSDNLSQATPSHGYLSINSDYTMLSLSIENIGLLNIYGNNLLIDSAYTQYIVLIQSIDNCLNILIDVNGHNFILSNLGKVLYSDFTPYENLLSNINIMPLISFQAPVKLQPNKIYICEPSDEGNNWSLAGKTIYADVYLYVDRSKPDRLYGIDFKSTTIIGDLYILEKNSASLSSVNLNIINLTISNYIYIDLSNSFNLNYDHVKSKGLVFL